MHFPAIGGRGAAVGPVGYVVAHAVGAETLTLGTPVIVDAVNPVPEARTGWLALASSARLVVFETVVADEAERRRGVEARRADLPDQVPAWDEVRDGPRHVIDMTDTNHGAAAALEHLGSAAGPVPLAAARAGRAPS